MGAYVKIGDRIVVDIHDVAFGGDGVARVSDFVLFVPFAVDGEKAEVEITDIRKRYGRGRIVRIVEPSPCRVVPPCRYYESCGGCRMQHISYPHQLELKKRQIEEALKRIAGVSAPPVTPVIPSPQPFGWRGKAEFHLAARGREAGRIGLMASKSNTIVDIERCLIADESINLKYRILKEELNRVYNGEPTGRQVIWADEPGEAPTGVFSGSGKPPDILRNVMGKQLTVPGRGFFQANIFLVGRLVELVSALASLKGHETVIDLFGGVGLFSIFFGSGAKRVFCGEGDKEAVRCARINLDRAGLTEAKCFQGDAADILKRQFVDPGLKADVVVLDPPRDGCGEKLADLLAVMGPERIVYVSCNPSTLARDVRLLTVHGYCLEVVQPIDMFPQTSHIEAVALLSRSAD